MKAYYVEYRMREDKQKKIFTAHVDAKDKKSVEKKLARKHKVTDWHIVLTEVNVLGYL